MAGVPSGGLFAPPPQRGGLFAPPQTIGGLFAPLHGPAVHSGMILPLSKDAAGNVWLDPTAGVLGRDPSLVLSGALMPVSIDDEGKAVFDPTAGILSVLPISKDEKGNAQFDLDAGVVGDLKRALTLIGDVRSGEQPIHVVDQVTGELVIHPGLIERSADLASLPAAGMLPRVAKGAAKSLASSSVTMYDPPAKPPRPFEYDYPAGANAGRLEHDIEGRQLVAKHVVGRRMVGGNDEPLAPAEYAAVTKGVIGKIPEAVEAGALPEGVMGVYRRGYNAEGKLERYIGVLKTLPLEDAAKVTAHEIGHMIDDLARRLASDPGMPLDGIRKELRRVYHDLNDVSPRRGKPTPGHLQTRPEHFGYRGEQVDAELMAEAIRAYLADPNYLKSVAPKTAAAIRAAVNDNDQLRHIIQFNVGGAPGGLAVPSENEAQHR
jgi:hypothetical protein